MIIQILQKKDICKKYDLSSVRFVWSGAAPLGEEVINEVEQLFPTWTIAQAYGKQSIPQSSQSVTHLLIGMTETAVVISAPSELDVVKKTAGSLLPGCKAKLVGFDGCEITQYDTPGEILVQGPAVVLGYLNNEKANAETFVHHEDGRWIRTGDEAIVTLAPSGNEHIMIVDRIKELIKVKV
jgi:acyl-CoA synthetase (AMP-forming)/AMP-acid ligase II